MYNRIFTECHRVSLTSIPQLPRTGQLGTFLGLLPGPTTPRLLSCLEEYVTWDVSRACGRPSNPFGPLTGDDHRDFGASSTCMFKFPSNLCNTVLNSHSMSYYITKPPVLQWFCSMLCACEIKLPLPNPIQFILPRSSVYFSDDIWYCTAESNTKVWYSTNSNSIGCSSRYAARQKVRLLLYWVPSRVLASHNLCDRSSLRHVGKTIKYWHSVTATSLCPHQITAFNPVHNPKFSEKYSNYLTDQ